MDILKPRDEDEVLHAVRSALAAETPLEIRGQGSKRGLGHAVDATTLIDVTGLAGITMYEPTELVMTARPGTPMDEIDTLLAAHNQELAFEPMDPTRLWRGNRTGTIRRTVAAGLVDQVVDDLARAGIDALGRLVEHQDGTRRGHPAGDEHLLLVAAAQLGHELLGVGGAHVVAVDEVARAVALARA